MALWDTPNHLGEWEDCLPDSETNCLDGPLVEAEPVLAPSIAPAESSMVAEGLECPGEDAPLFT